MTQKKDVRRRRQHAAKGCSAARRRATAACSPRPSTNRKRCCPERGWRWSCSKTDQAATGDSHTWKLHREEQSAPLTDYRTGQTRTVKMVSMLVPEGWEMKPQPSPERSARSTAMTTPAASCSARAAVTGLSAFWCCRRQLRSGPPTRHSLQQKRQFNQQWKVSICDVKPPQPLTAYLQENTPKIMPGTQTLGRRGSADTGAHRAVAADRRRRQSADVRAGRADVCRSRPTAHLLQRQRTPV